MFGFFRSKPGKIKTTLSPSVLRYDSVRNRPQVIHPFKKKFDYEVNSWCYGFETLGEVPLPQVVYKVVREFRPVFIEAIASGYLFDIDYLARRLFESSKKVVPLKELAMALVAVLPDPENLPLDQKRVFTLVLAQVELSHAGAVTRVKQRLHATLESTAKDQVKDSAHPAPQAPLLLGERA